MSCQESLDHLNRSKNDEQQIQSLKAEIQRISRIESSYENAKVSSLHKFTILIKRTEAFTTVLVPFCFSPYFLSFSVFFFCALNFFFIHVCVFLLCFTFDLIVLWKFDVLSAGEYENFHDLDGGMDELHIALSRLCTLSRTRLLTKTICLLG